MLRSKRRAPAVSRAWSLPCARRTRVRSSCTSASASSAKGSSAEPSASTASTATSFAWRCSSSDVRLYRITRAATASDRISFRGQERSVAMIRICTAMLSFFAVFSALAQDYPNKPIRLITPAAQGGTTDLLARVFGAKLAEVFGQQIVVDNRASAAGVIAGQMTASAPADGYTLLLAYHQHTVNAALNPQLPYHPVEDFTPITQLTSAGLMLVVNPKSPPQNLAEFIDWTKKFQGRS